ncbi:MAG: hypothetical protein IK093_15975 [Ruminiclostridium sp.]|nr:hypothetical protein [Ruminiclostridium sp.]
MIILTRKIAAVISTAIMAVGICGCNNSSTVNTEPAPETTTSASEPIKPDARVYV